MLPFCFLIQLRLVSLLDSVFGKRSSIKKFKNKKERLEYRAQNNKDYHTHLNTEKENIRWSISKKIATSCLIFFVIFHLLFPLRHFLLTTNPEWTGISSRFAWRMKMQSRKVTDFKMSLTDRKSNITYNLDGKSYVSKNQFIHMTEDPYTFIHLAKYISKKLKKERGIINPIITSAIKVEFNGLPKQYMISPDVDLTQINESPFAENSWIPSLKKNKSK